MSTRTLLLVFAQILLIQSISTQCIGGYGYDGLAYDGYTGLWGNGLAASNSLAVSSASSLIPAGVSVLSENAYEGTLIVNGALPFLGTVALEGILPTSGAGVVAYSCGNGVVGITAEDAGGYAYGPAGSYGYASIGGPYGCGYAGIAEPFGYGYAGIAEPLGYGYAGIAKPFECVASSGPGLAVSSASPLIPSGVSVLSENAYEGALAVGGTLPFLGTVTLEGALPTAGAGAIAYGCGNGAVAITAEDHAYSFDRAGALGYRPSYAGC